MNLMNCSGCGKLQIRQYQSLCHECLQGHMDDSHKIRSFLQQHPRASILELYQATGIPLKKINELVRR